MTFEHGKLREEALNLHPRLGRGVAFCGAEAIARTSRGEDAATVAKDGNAPRLVHREPGILSDRILDPNYTLLTST